MSEFQGADVELIEFCEKPEDILITIPNAAIINGQRVYLDADHPVKVEYDQTGKDGQFAVVTLRLQVRRLLIEPRRKIDITNAASFAGEANKVQGAVATPSPAQAPDEATFKKRDQEYFALVGKRVRYKDRLWRISEYYVGMNNYQWFRLSREGEFDQGGVARTEFEVQDV